MDYLLTHAPHLRQSFCRKAHTTSFYGNELELDVERGIREERRGGVRERKWRSGQWEREQGGKKGQGGENEIGEKRGREEERRGEKGQETCNFFFHTFYFLF